MQFSLNKEESRLWGGVSIRPHGRSCIADQRRPIVGDIIRSFVIPDHEFSIVTTSHIGRRFFVSFDLTVSSDYLTPLFDPETFSNRAFQFDAMAKADVEVGYRLPLAEHRSLRFYGKVENLFDRMYYDGGYRMPGATAIGGLQFEF